MFETDGLACRFSISNFFAGRSIPVSLPTTRAASATTTNLGICMVQQATALENTSRWQGKQRTQERLEGDVVLQVTREILKHTRLCYRKREKFWEREKEEREGNGGLTVSFVDFLGYTILHLVYLTTRDMTSSEISNLRWYEDCGRTRTIVDRTIHRNCRKVHTSQANNRPEGNMRTIQTFHWPSWCLLEALVAMVSGIGRPRKRR